jgi:hypothetical protein
MSLVRQVHQWALTEFSDFVVQHMRQWSDYYDGRVLALKEKGKEEGRRMKKRDRDSGEKPSESKVDLKRLRSLPHPWWGMQPLYRPDLKPAESEGPQKIDID